MRFDDLLLEYTVGEWTFGFELEAYFPIALLSKWTKKSEAELDAILKSRGAPALYESMKPYFDSTFSKLFTSEYIIKEDQSVTDIEYGAIPFELIPVGGANFNISQMSNLNKMIVQWAKDGIYTNAKCGFHIHFRSSAMGIKEAAWIGLHYALAADKRLYTLLTKSPFTVSPPNRFETRFSRTPSNDSELRDHQLELFDYIGTVASAAESTDSLQEWLSPEAFQKLLFAMFQDKQGTFPLLMIHPQGTIEWRGPRGVMDAIIEMGTSNLGKVTSNINALVKRSYAIVQEFNDILNSKTLNFSNGDVSRTIDRSVIEGMLDRHNRSSITFKTHSDDKFTQAVEKAGIVIDKQILMRVKTLFQKAKVDIAKLRCDNLQIKMSQNSSSYIEEQMLSLTQDSNAMASISASTLKTIGDIAWPGEISIDNLNFISGTLTINTGSIITSNILAGGTIFIYDNIKFSDNIITGTTIESTKLLKVKRVLEQNYLQINDELDYGFVDQVDFSSGIAKTKLLFRNVDLKNTALQSHIGSRVYNVSELDDYIVVNSVKFSDGTLSQAIAKFIDVNCDSMPKKFTDAEANYFLTSVI